MRDSLLVVSKLSKIKMNLFKILVNNVANKFLINNYLFNHSIFNWSGLVII